MTNQLSFPACLCATGTRIFCGSREKEDVQRALTTCGTLDHDIARDYKHYYHGSFNWTTLVGPARIDATGQRHRAERFLRGNHRAWCSSLRTSTTIDSQKRGRREPMPGLDSVPSISFGNWASASERDPDHGLQNIESRLHPAHRRPSAQLHVDRSIGLSPHTLADEQIMSDLTWTLKPKCADGRGGISKHHVICGTNIEVASTAPFTSPPHPNTMAAFGRAP